MTTHPVEAYGGVQFDERVVAEVADAVASGRLPMHFNHDISRPVGISNVPAGTETLPDGHVAAWAEFDVDADVWATFQSELAAAGAPGGMSVSLTVPLAEEELEPDADTVVAADAHHFSDSDIRAAMTDLRRLDAQVHGQRLMQFSSEPAAKVIFDLVVPVVQALGPNLAASVLYDAAKHFLLKPGRTGHIVFNVLLRESRRGTKTLKIHIRANDPEQFRTALQNLPSVLDSGSNGTFVSDNGDPIHELK
jgi:hypothetical protein